MGLFDRFIVWLGRVFGRQEETDVEHDGSDQLPPEHEVTPTPDPDPPEPEEDDEESLRPVPPLTYTGNGDAYRLGVALYQTVALTEKNGRHPEENSARFLGQALRDAGYNYTISFGYAPVDLGDAADRDILRAFREMEPAGEDANLLIGDRWGGGWGGGRHGLVAGRRLNKPLELVEEAPTRDDGKVWWPHKHIINHLHELGHILGGAHKDEMTNPPSLLYNNVEDGWMDSPAP